ncbi:hypothetical protein DUI87_16547 [Hirundo rustica rustica]|uniref:Reverse transcriptase domain-containing protein n=1 Tax=Hirundo rustica rustica TaxID=333673 RepID=A0A3M0K3U4_HIRRU|nr:hypothetical protein DUI87_16547 [Hirundo rustica rustica]
MGEQLVHRMGTKGCSEWGDIRLVTCHYWGSSVSILGPVFFNIFINDLDTGLEGKFSDDMKLGRAVGSLEGREALQRDPDKSEVWAITTHMKFKDKCQTLHLGWATLDVQID